VTGTATVRSGSNHPSRFFFVFLLIFTLGAASGGVLIALKQPQAGTNPQAGNPVASPQAGGHSQAPAPPDGRRGFGPNPYPGPGGPGQGPQGDQQRPWWKDPAIVKEVGLTADQVTKIDKIYDRRNKLIASQVEEYNRLHAELDKMLSERTVSPETVEIQAQRMMPFHMAIDVSRIKMGYEMSRVLTTEQNDKLRAVFDRMGPDRGRGRGNPPRH